MSSVLELRANVDPLSTYELKVSASSSLLDGFKQPLSAGAVTEYTASGTSVIFVIVVVVFVVVK